MFARPFCRGQMYCINVQHIIYSTGVRNIIYSIAYTVQGQVYNDQHSEFSAWGQEYNVQCSIYSAGNGNIM